MQKSISSFAEELLLQDISDIKKGKKVRPNTNSVTPVVLEQNQLDISETQVPDDYVQKLLQESFGIKTDKGVAVSVPKASNTKEISLEETTIPNLNEAISKIDDLIVYLTECKNSLKEMTTAGMLGVNFAGPQKKVRKKLKLKAKLK